jgi:hypothetical protein
MTLRVIMGLVLSVLLSLTSVTMAMARVQIAGSMQISICSGDGTHHEITLDANGNPIDVPHHCPDCAAATAPPPGALAPDRAQPIARSAPQVCALILPDTVQTPPVPPARGPPSGI